jgi:hypothetical protein
VRPNFLLLYNTRGRTNFLSGRVKLIVTSERLNIHKGKGISFKNRLKGHINWRKVRNLNVI